MVFQMMRTRKLAKAKLWRPAAIVLIASIALRRINAYNRSGFPSWDTNLLTRHSLGIDSFFLFSAGAFTKAKSPRACVDARAGGGGGRTPATSVAPRIYAITTTPYSPLAAGVGRTARRLTPFFHGAIAPAAQRLWLQLLRLLCGTFAAGPSVFLKWCAIMVLKPFAQKTSRELVGLWPTNKKISQRSGFNSGREA